MTKNVLENQLWTKQNLGPPHRSTRGRFPIDQDLPQSLVPEASLAAGTVERQWFTGARACIFHCLVAAAKAKPLISLALSKSQCQMGSYGCRDQTRISNIFYLKHLLPKQIASHEPWHPSVQRQTDAVTAWHTRLRGDPPDVAVIVIIAIICDKMCYHHHRQQNDHIRHIKIIQNMVLLLHLSCRSQGSGTMFLAPMSYPDPLQCCTRWYSLFESQAFTIYPFCRRHAVQAFIRLAA